MLARIPESLLSTSSSFPLPENTTHRPRGGNGLALRNVAALAHNQRNGTATSRAELLVHQFHIVTVSNERRHFRFGPYRIGFKAKTKTRAIANDCTRRAGYLGTEAPPECCLPDERAGHASTGGLERLTKSGTIMWRQRYEQEDYLSARPGLVTGNRVNAL